MNDTTETTAVTKVTPPLVAVRHELIGLEGQFKAALPAHIPVERFMRVVMTAIQNNLELLDVPRRQLWNAAMKAAQDGLLPDNRDGAMVTYMTTKQGLVVQWMPMIGGLRKKVRNSGEIATWDANVVYEKDLFDYELGDEPRIYHKPHLGGDRGKIIAAYSVAVLKSGERSREVMSIEEIEGVRTKSKGKNTPWNDPIFYPEMCRKTVARRHSKVLPMSTDLDDLMRRDDALYDLEGKRREAEEQAKAAGVATATGSALDAFAAMGNGNGGPAIEQEAAQVLDPSSPYEMGRAARLTGEGYRSTIYDNERDIEEYRRGWQDEDKQQHTGEVVDETKPAAETRHDEDGVVIEDEADAGEPIDIKAWIAELDDKMAKALNENDLAHTFKEYAAPNKPRVQAKDWREAEKVFERHSTRLGL